MQHMGPRFKSSLFWNEKSEKPGHPSEPPKKPGQKNPGHPRLSVLFILWSLPSNPMPSATGPAPPPAHRPIPSGGRGGRRVGGGDPHPRGAPRPAGLQQEEVRPPRGRVHVPPGGLPLARPEGAYLPCPQWSEWVGFIIIYKRKLSKLYLTKCDMIFF